MAKVKTDRSLIMIILLNIITCGIYSLFFINGIANDVNTFGKDDGKSTKGILGFIILSAVTCGIYGIIWWYSVANRVAENGNRYGVTGCKNGSSFLMWNIFGSLLCGLGPLIALNNLCKDLNNVGMAYNKTLDVAAQA